MRIALTHNLQLSAREEEAEFDRPETIAALADALRRLGHEVEPVEVSGPASRTVARLEALQPELIFNTAEGQRGRYREAFYPGLFDELGMPFTGSDAYVCALTLDKRLTKLVLAAYGVPTPRFCFVDGVGGLSEVALTYPIIVKPNYEGSSKGIDQDSVLEDASQLEAKVRSLLARYPSGVLIEEYIEGRDVTVPFLEVASPATGGVLSPAEYGFDRAIIGDRKYVIYDYGLKQELSHAVTVKVPADLEPQLRKRMLELSRKVVAHLGIRDLGRMDYRVTPDGRIYFLEVNALPSLEPGASLYESAALAGIKTIDGVLDAVIRSAAARRGLKVAKSKPSRKRRRIGLIFNLKRNPVSGSDDSQAEYDSPTTIHAIADALRSYGHEVVELEATAELPAILPATGIDVAFNIAEGMRGRNREAQVPALLELLDVPYTGSDPATLSLALDKTLAKRVVSQAGIKTPPFLLMTTGRERLPKDFWFPAVIKPYAEGSSKGVVGTSVVEDEATLRARAPEMAARYGQPALVESYLGGREFTVGLLGEQRPRVLPPMEILFQETGRQFPVYSFEDKLGQTGLRYDTPAKLEPPLARALDRAARTVFAALGCRDVARIDFRLDARGEVHFLECNPLPGLTPDWSDLCLIAKSAGMEYRTLVGEILAPALRRLREQERSRLVRTPEIAGE